MDASDPGTDRWRARSALAFAVGSIALLALIVPRAASLIDAPFPGFFTWDNGVLVSLHRADWTGPRAGLPLNGGVVVGVEGRDFDGGRALLDATADLPPGSPVAYDVRTQESIRTYSVPTMRLSGSDWSVTVGSYLLNAITLLVCATLALYLKPDHEQTRALALASGVAGATTLLVIDAITEFRFVQAARLGEALLPAAIVNLALVFPRTVAPRRTRRRLALVVAIAMVGVFFASLAIFETNPARSRTFTAITYVTIALASIGLLANYAWSLLRAESAEERTRAAVVCAGGLPAFAVAGFGILAFNLLGWTFSWSWVFFLVPLAPLSMLYAAVAQNLFDAERVLRLSVGYVLATGVLISVYALLLAGLDRFLLDGASQDPASAFLLVLVVALFFDPARRWVQGVVDRAFYRSPLDYSEQLARASQELPTLQGAAAIESYVRDFLRDVLRLESVEWAAPDEAADGAALVQAVTFRGELQGLIACGAKLSGAPFAPQERAFVRALAAQTALALHNARTLEDLREAESRLRIQERLAAVGEFAGAIAHGIRNPLAGIRIGIEVTRETANDESTRRSLDDVVAEVDRLEQRIRNLLHYSRPYTLERRAVDLASLLDETVEMTRALAERKDIRLDVRRPPAPVVRSIDPDFVTQALIELVKNAIESMPEGGTVELALEERERTAILRVRDTGPGVPESQRDRIFDLFYTTRREGTGIGLATVKRIVEAHGGRLALEPSGEGGGACFTLQFEEQ